MTVAEAHTSGGMSELTGNRRTTRQYLTHAVQSLRKEFTARKAADAFQRERLQPKEDPLREACFWIIEALPQGVLTHDEVAAIDAIRRRNDVAHQLPALLFTK